MINYYQPWLLPFLGLDRHETAPHIRRYYYFSFEDGLWDFLEKEREKGTIPLGSVILIPDFYCVDVINNITHHGYVCELYPLDSNFQISEKELVQKVKNTKARMLFIFHVCGITSTVLSESLCRKLPEEVLIIEDAVNRLVNPSSIRLFDDRHIVMDSLRKVTPLPGSFMYGPPSLLNEPQTNRWFTWYTLVATMYFIVFRLVFSLAILLYIPALVVWAHSVLLQLYDDLIGDSVQGHRGLPFIPFVFDHINFTKVTRMKTNQVRAYEEALIPFIQRHKDVLYKVTIDEEDYGKLRVYPLGLRRSPDEKLIEYLHEQDCLVWFGFPDAPWSQDHSVLQLPLGFHITQKDITHIVDSLEQYL